MLVLCQIPLLRHPSRTQIHESHDYKHQAALSVLSKRSQIMEVYVKHIWLSGSLVGQAQSLAEPSGLQYVGAPRSFWHPLLQALWRGPPHSDLPPHFGCSISILLILHDSSHSPLYTSTQQKDMQRAFLTFSHLSLLWPGWEQPEMQRILSLLLWYPSLCMPSQAFQSPANRYMSWASQPLHRLCLTSCTIPRCWHLASRQLLVPTYILDYQTVVIILLHKDLIFMFLQFSAFSFHAFHSLGAAAGNECRSQMWKKHYCPADPADLKVMHCVLQNGPEMFSWTSWAEKKNFQEYQSAPGADVQCNQAQESRRSEEPELWRFEDILHPTLPA